MSPSILFVAVHSMSYLPDSLSPFIKELAFCTSTTQLSILNISAITSTHIPYHRPAVIHTAMLNDQTFPSRRRMGRG